MLKDSQVISASPEIMSGIPVFIGTRVTVQTLFDYLKAGESIDDFLDGFPTVTREQVITFLEENQLVTEVNLLSQNQEVMEFLAQRSRSTNRVSLEEARNQIGI